MVSEVGENKTQFNGESLTIGQAAELLSRSREVRRKDVGCISFHWLENDTDRLMLVQGPNGEFEQFREGTLH